MELGSRAKRKRCTVAVADKVDLPSIDQIVLLQQQQFVEHCARVRYVVVERVAIDGERRMPGAVALHLGSLLATTTLHVHDDLVVLQRATRPTGLVQCREPTRALLVVKHDEQRQLHLQTNASRHPERNEHQVRSIAQESLCIVSLFRMFFVFDFARLE